MAREVTHEATGPKPIDEDDFGDDGKAYICQCGLSDDRPFCDGSHRAVADEEDGVVYKYEGEGRRREIEEIRYAEE
ncbi:CDGSH iron-sulfur domain-containing protein [Halovenus sp. WSH3]|uniref:CDGSH iron-sulfur domain-containing protein n=1 Tax=Halovenus carboxidivorans TaxID=2692199 RepID=A0A6B0T3Q7_9EURY|nr:CDGSH iron-sulfur domain-containing protein [Halovenus carboxidivorans]MXR52704.1 CDGSH iron-sulfur domain-containing protein [Halovenus carboxidivorans]